MPHEKTITISGLLRDALIADDPRWAKIVELAGDDPKEVFSELPMPELRGLIAYLAQEIENDIALYRLCVSPISKLVDILGTARFHGRNLALSRMTPNLKIADYVYWAVLLIAEVQTDRKKLERQMSIARSILSISTFR